MSLYIKIENKEHTEYTKEQLLKLSKAKHNSKVSSKLKNSAKYYGTNLAEVQYQKAMKERLK